MQTHARLQKASLTPCDGGDTLTLQVTQQPEGSVTFKKQLSKKVRVTVRATVRANPNPNPNP